MALSLGRGEFAVVSELKLVLLNAALVCASFSPKSKAVSATPTSITVWLKAGEAGASERLQEILMDADVSAIDVMITSNELAAFNNKDKGVSNKEGQH